jgi:probable biosynthetic protein (TIGR04098 family)
MKAWTTEGTQGIALGPGAVVKIASAPALDQHCRVHLRLVTTDDAPFLYALRCDPKLNRYLSPAPSDVAGQRAWIARYKEREARGEEFYFVICGDGRDYGSVRMYDFREVAGQRSFGWGSWIVKPQGLAGLARFSAIMIYELGLETLGFDQGHFEVEHDNPSLDMHQRMGATRHGEREGSVMFSFSQNALRALKNADRQLIAKYRQYGPNQGPAPRAAQSPRLPGPPDKEEDQGATQLVIGHIQFELPSFSSHQLATPFDLLGVDSFAMLTLRTRLEQSLEITIDDASWTSVITPADVVRIVEAIQPGRNGTGWTGVSAGRRAYNLNMPQMALGGLSESWLFKEMGDLHWSLITTGLGRSSSQIKDASGNRLYATFTRLRIGSTAPFAEFAENETITIEGEVSRYGAGMFFTNAVLTGAGKSAQISLMSSFSKYGQAGANTSLLKGQPEIPPGCQIPALTEMPAFGEEYRARRAAQLSKQIFECEYEIIPPHDINGVGLLYFAAYPIINDICAMRYAGRSFATDFSTTNRDVYYFSNSDPNETLIYRIHRWHANEGHIEMEATISRKTDGVLMAYVMTEKDRVRG